MARSRDAGLRKRCTCSRRKWAACRHPWWFGFHFGGREYRFSLNKEANQERLTADKAKQLKDHYRTQIRDGTFRQLDSLDGTPRETRVTFGYVADEYVSKHVAAPGRREAGRKLMAWYVAALRVADLPTHQGGTVQLQDKAIADVTTADVQTIRDSWRRRASASHGGRIGADRALKRLRHLFNWAIERGHVDHTPFRRHGVTVVHFETERGRSRRLEDGEETRLLKHASPYMQALITAALCTGCRVGELLSLQWRDVRWSQGVLLLPAEHTKTATARDVPITSSLTALLDMRRHAPDGTELPSDAYVFGNEVGERVKNVRAEWDRTCRAANITGLHFHDLRREFGSRLRETPGITDHEVRDWLGHANLSTTSRYLATTRVGLQHAARKFDQGHTPGSTGRGIRTPFAQSTPDLSITLTLEDDPEAGKSVS